jgi:hypothetical protein
MGNRGHLGIATAYSGEEALQRLVAMHDRGNGMMTQHVVGDLDLDQAIDPCSALHDSNSTSTPSRLPNLFSTKLSPVPSTQRYQSPNSFPRCCRQFKHLGRDFDFMSEAGVSSTQNRGTRQGNLDMPNWDVVSPLRNYHRGQTKNSENSVRNREIRERSSRWPQIHHRWAQSRAANTSLSCNK